MGNESFFPWESLRTTTDLILIYLDGPDLWLGKGSNFLIVTW